MIDVLSLSTRVTAETGLPFSGREGLTPGGERQLILAPEGHHAAQTFQLVLKLGWRSLEANFEQGAYSGELISAMGAADEGGRGAFRAVLESCIAEDATVTLRVNGTARPIGDPTIWGEQWKTFGLTVRKGQLPLDSQTDSTADALIVKWLSRAAAALVALLPLDEADDAWAAAAEERGLPEGAAVSVSVNRYERNRRNRAAALAIHGCACKACGVLMADRYGDVAADYIEVHHVTPVSQLGPGYIVDPRKDLVPLCPNCHGVAHRRSPPFDVDELREMVTRPR